MSRPIIREALNDTLHESMLRQQTAEQLERIQIGHEAILAALLQGDAEVVMSLLHSATAENGD